MKIWEAYVAPKRKWGKDLHPSSSLLEPLFWSPWNLFYRLSPCPSPGFLAQGKLCGRKLTGCISEAPQTFLPAVPNSGSLWSLASPGFVPSYQVPGLQEHQPPHGPEPGACGLGCFLRQGVGAGWGCIPAGREASCERGLLAETSVLNRVRPEEGKRCSGQRLEVGGRWKGEEERERVRGREASGFSGQGGSERGRRETRGRRRGSVTELGQQGDIEGL